MPLGLSDSRHTSPSEHQALCVLNARFWGSVRLTLVVAEGGHGHSLVVRVWLR